MLKNLRKRSMGYEEIVFSPSSSAKKRNRRRNAVAVVVGEEKIMFTVEPQILDSGFFQPLMEKATVGRITWKANGRKNPSWMDCIFLDCDAILFEHMLWLVNNDDPSLRYLNLDMLMEFYAQ